MRAWQRDAIRHIQQARKDAGLDVSDRIGLKLSATDGALKALKTHQDLLMHETLAKEFDIAEAETAELQVGEQDSISIKLAKVD
jgi:hypothetical protein